MSVTDWTGLTGNIRYRTGFFGRLILQVEQVTESKFHLMNGAAQKKVIWRDAKREDLIALRDRDLTTKPGDRQPPPERHTLL